MSTTEHTLSINKLRRSKEYREAFVSAFLKRFIPFQIRAIRKKRGMSQHQLAEASKVTQGVISRAEDPDYGNLTLNTVLRIAAGYDLAFVGKFVPFGELIKTVDEMSEDAWAIPSFTEEYAQADIPQAIGAKLGPMPTTPRINSNANNNAGAPGASAQGMRLVNGNNSVEHEAVMGSCSSIESIPPQSDTSHASALERPA